MSMRTFEQLKDAINRANGTSDSEMMTNAAVALGELGTEESRALSLTARGYVFRMRGQYAEAMEQFLQALDVFEKTGNKPGLAMSHTNLGVSWWYTGDYPRSLKHHHQTLALHEALGDRSNIAATCTNIGNVYYRIDDLNSALTYYNRALSVHEELGDRSSIAVDTICIGNVHFSNANYPAALEHFNRALTVHEEFGNRSGIAHATVNMIGTYIEMGADDEARMLIERMDAMQFDDLDARISRETYRAKLKERCKEYDEAVAILMAARQDALAHGMRSELIDIHKALRDIALLRADIASYVEHNNEFTRITEEINGKNTATILAMHDAERDMATERQEHQKHLAVLHSTLPKHIAERVARGEVVTDHFDNAAILFLDVVGFTTHSSELEAATVVDLLQKIFTTFDAICSEHDVMKIKTIGDSYMAVAFPRFARNDNSLTAHSSDGPVIPNEVRNVQRAASAACAMIASSFTWPNGDHVQFRIGLHSGPVVAGVLGTERMQYDVWGDTVNVASRMESSSEPGRIHVSSSFALALNGEMAKERKGETDVIPSASEEPGASSPFPVPCSLLERGALEIKGKGTMTTYWLEGPLT